MTVQMPADNATLFINGQAMDVQGLQRTFSSPELDASQKYQYEMTAVWQVNGKEYKSSQNVIVQAGGNVEVSFAGTPSGDLPVESVFQNTKQQK